MCALNENSTLYASFAGALLPPFKAAIPAQLSPCSDYFLHFQRQPSSRTMPHIPKQWPQQCLTSLSNGRHPPTNAPDPSTPHTPEHCPSTRPGTPPHPRHPPQVPGHDFDVGRHVLTGRNSPWNTFALWSVAKLAQVGFMPISEGIFGIPGGVEEGPVIALLQRLQPSSMCCKLVQLDPAPKWHRDWSDPQRLQWHQEKMQSKVTRTTSQLEYMHLPEAFVDHIQVTVPSHESGVP